MTASSIARPLRRVASVLMLAAIVWSPSSPRSDPGPAPRSVKVLVIAATGVESQGWIDELALSDTVAVPGLSPAYPVLRCNADDVCLLTTGPGKANAAASVSAVIHSGELDLAQAYFLVAGLARIDPAQGTIGSVAWARHAVDYAIAWEIDARTMPDTWTTGYLGIGAANPTIKPTLMFGSELFALSTDLEQQAFALSTAVTLDDHDAARAYRAHYLEAAAAAPPRVIECDTATSDTQWHGALLGTRARDWVALLTDGQATYCTTQQTDNATITALTRGGEAGLLDAGRIAVLRAAWHFDRQYPGQTAYDSLGADAGGLPLATRNLVLAGAPLISEIVARWGQWQAGVPR
jgi:purine nucleoside permease